VGKTALERLPGIVRGEAGFVKSSEVDTVYYDPAKITLKDMEDALKKAGTYISTRGN
jgi:copper chaperone CopZ